MDDERESFGSPFFVFIAIYLHHHLFVLGRAMIISKLLTFPLVNVGMPRMRRFTLVMMMFAVSGMINGCVGLPDFNNLLIPATNDKKPNYARGSEAGQATKGRVPLDVPPELRAEVNVPMPDQVAVDVARGDVKMSAEEKKAVAGKAVSLDTRLYTQSPAKVFSTVIDAMTALNLPVDSVDSPSGTITTTWIHPNSNTVNSYVGAAMSMFGAGPTYERHRFIVRVFRDKNGQTQLQVRTLGQSFINRHWVFKAIKRKMANELFSAVEERLVQPVSSPPNDTGTSLPTGNP